MGGRLEPSEIRVLHASSAALSDAARRACLRVLSDDERARHLRFRFEQDRDAYLLAHALTRTLLAGQLEVEPRALRFKAGPHGRPELDWPRSSPALRFNLSHTRGLVACALALEHDVGVDVEHFERRVELEQVARSVFSEPERAALMALPPEGRRRRFFELWTLKEAYIKAVGKGLALPLRAITLELAPAAPPRLQLAAPIQDNAERWFFALDEPAPGYLLAVAAGSPSCRCAIGEWLPLQ